MSSELDILSEILGQRHLNELMFNGHQRVFVEHAGKLRPMPSPLKSKEEFDQLLQALMHLPNTVSIGRLQFDGMLPDGSRFHITQPPQSPDFSTLSIRKFVPAHSGLEKLVATGSLTQKAAKFLEAAVKARLNVLISGAASAGKTTLLNSLCAKIDANERVITIEDIPEMQLTHPNWVRLIAVPQEPGGSVRDCVVGSLRMRPDRIIVGECRSSEALEMLQAMNTGHDGGMTTLHANSTKDALARLESLILFHAGAEIPLRSLRRQIVDALDMVIHLRKHSSGRREVDEILEIESMEGDIITRSSLFKRDPAKGDRLLSTGIVPGFLERFKARNIELPQFFFDPAAFEEEETRPR